ncbi:GNAT family N-acetyltransferase [Actinocatenispora comari]|uniref:N-acetyltransferase n=1 Tax=Actinocatenispora comari TaxID=2807577 RepID=A0A8J4AAJ9_9ACTN|nr:GNAT family N-acetyltransferase [Actinocatenispora comari]GIL26779.1 N-acetyltransferase [Actinocatenispora comari]
MVGTYYTQRLRLEPITAADAVGLWRLHADEPVAIWWLGRLRLPAAQAVADEMAAGWARDGVHKWLAYDRVSGELIGRGGLSYQHVDGARRLEIGWIVRARYWGRGYATEIGRAGLDVGFGELGADEIVAFTEPDNRRSRAVMERLGMRDPRPITHRGEHFVLYTLPRPSPRPSTRHSR